MRKMRAYCLILAALLLAAGWAYPVNATLQDDKSAKKDKSEKKSDKKKKKDDLVTTPRDKKAVLWTEPTNMESLDLFAGPAGAQSAPDPNGKYTFKSRAASGTSEKINVLDGSNKEWQIKFGAETKPAPAASRIVWRRAIIRMRITSYDALTSRDAVDLTSGTSDSRTRTMATKKRGSGPGTQIRLWVPENSMV